MNCNEGPTETVLGIVKAMVVMMAITSLLLCVGHCYIMNVLIDKVNMLHTAACNNINMFGQRQARMHVCVKAVLISQAAVKDYDTGVYWGSQIFDHFNVTTIRTRVENSPAAPNCILKY